MIGVYEAAPLCGASEAPECIRVLHNQLHPHITSGDINSLCRLLKFQTNIIIQVLI